VAACGHPDRSALQGDHDRTDPGAHTSFQCRWRSAGAGNLLDRDALRPAERSVDWAGDYRYLCSPSSHAPDRDAEQTSAQLALPGGSARGRPARYGNNGGSAAGPFPPGQGKPVPAGEAKHTLVGPPKKITPLGRQNGGEYPPIGARGRRPTPGGKNALENPGGALGGTGGALPPRGGGGGGKPLAGEKEAQKSL